MQQLRKMETQTSLRILLSVFSLSFLLGAIFAPDHEQMLPGLWRIITQPAVLTKDYFHPELGSVSGAFLNASLVGAVFCCMLHLPGAVANGSSIVAYMLTLGFCFFGINILNILPFILGTFIYSLYKREPFGKNINFAMFSTALAPFISEILFRYPEGVERPVTPFAIFIAIMIGLLISLDMPAICAHSMNFHEGYDLYNAGPAAGFLGLVLFALMYKVAGVTPPEIKATLSEGYSTYCNIFAGALFVNYLIVGIWVSGGFKGYLRLLLDRGYKKDFIVEYGLGPSLINFGFYGLFILSYYNIIGATFTGPTFGVIWCMVAYCAAGATPINVTPILLGYFVGSLFGENALNSQAIVVGACFASGLAPITGTYGLSAGVTAGLLHYCIVTNIPAIHGGFNLYNGGFAAGIVSFVFLPILKQFTRPLADRRASFLKKGWFKSKKAQ